MEKDEEKIYYKLQAENEKLNLQIQNLLKCDKCSECFNDKYQIKVHILSNHLVKVVNCNICGNKFDTKDDLKVHVTKRHSNENRKLELKEKQHQLLLSITKSKHKLFQDLLTLNDKEVKK